VISFRFAKKLLLRVCHEYATVLILPTRAGRAPILHQCSFGAAAELRRRIDWMPAMKAAGQWKKRPLFGGLLSWGLRGRRYVWPSICSMVFIQKEI